MMGMNPGGGLQLKNNVTSIPEKHGMQIGAARDEIGEIGANIGVNPFWRPQIGGSKKFFQLFLGAGALHFEDSKT